MVFKINKYIFVILIVFVLINIMISPVVFADETRTTNFFCSVNGYRVLGSGEEKTTKELTTEVGATAFMILLRGLQIIGTGFFVIRFTIFGIQYFLTAAVQEKADLKRPRAGLCFWTR